MTNLVQFIPAAGVTDVLGPVLEVVKQVAVGAFGGLEGIMAMDPAGTDLKDFNDSPGSAAAYRVVMAEFEPPPGSSLGRIARDAGTDLVFGGVANDLVVPTQGAWDLPETPGFPVGPETGSSSTRPWASTTRPTSGVRTSRRRCSAGCRADGIPAHPRGHGIPSPLRGDPPRPRVFCHSCSP